MRLFTLTALALSISALSTVTQADPQSQEYVPITLKGSSEQEQASGFVDGYAIVGGRLEKVVGGGLCQVSTTLFRAVSNAGLEVTKRQGHTYVVYFYENILGFDATVFSPSLDFR